MVASNNADNIQNAMKKLNHAKTIIKPNNNPILKKYHQCKYKVFKKMIDDFNEYNQIMKQFKE